MNPGPAICTGVPSLFPNATVTMRGSDASRLQSRNSPEASVLTSRTTRRLCRMPVRLPRARTVARGSGTPVKASVTMPPADIGPPSGSAEHQADRMVDREGTVRVTRETDSPSTSTWTGVVPSPSVARRW